MIVNVVKRIIHQLPHVGDAVWWAPKQVGCIVVKTFANGRAVFQGGPIVENNPNGRQVSRWTVSAAPGAFKWHPGLRMWVVGEGVVPKDRSTIVITPLPVSLAGVAKGTFARG